MHAASLWRIAAPFLAIAAINVTVNVTVNATEPPAAKLPARPKAAAAADDPFGDTSRPRLANRPAEKAKQAARAPVAKAKQAAREAVATVGPLDPLLYAYLPYPTPAERKVETALSSPTPPIEFTETPLKDIIEYLKDAAHIEMQLDLVGMKDAGIDPEEQVSKNIRGVSLVSALDMLLDEVGLAWEIRHEVLFITTPKRLAEHRTTKLYVVADLVPAGGKDGKPQDDYATLIDLITATVAPGSWDGKGSTGSIKGATLGGPKVLSFSAQQKLALEAAPELGGAKVLSVSATYQVHRELAEYLANIRRIHKGGGAVQDFHDAR